MAGMGALIIILLGFGFTSIQKQIETGDSIINSQLVEIKLQSKETNSHFIELSKDVATLKANQTTRLERERIEAERKARSGKP
jgi:phage anti-repressor protein